MQKRKLIRKVRVLSKTKQLFCGKTYYKCGEYFQKNGERLHRTVWIYHKGKIPKGFHVHHKDEDKSNNQFRNLELLQNSEHVSLHQKGHGRKPSKQALDAASKWHGSSDGNEWHSKHYENTKEALHKKVDRECTHCGKLHESNRKKVNSFCSNKCKTAWRKASGIDDIDRECVICTTIFSINKYASRQTCSGKCSSKLRSLSRPNRKS